MKAPPNRINVLGTSGSGKSTFSRKLAEKLQHPYIEMDRVFWKPHWTEPTDEEFFAKLRAALAGPCWVLDGNYTRSIPIKWEKVEVVVWLDYSFSRTLYQAVLRSVRRCWSGEELWPETNNRESFQKSFFSKQSIIWWTITTYHKTRERNLKYMRDGRFSHIQFVHLRSHKEAESFLKSFGRDDAAPKAFKS